MPSFTLGAYLDFLDASLGIRAQPADTLGARHWNEIRNLRAEFPPVAVRAPCPDDYDPITDDHLWLYLFDMLATVHWAVLTDQACYQAIGRALKTIPSSCLSHDCTSDKISPLKGAKHFRCRKCQREYTVTQGTIFFKTKQPIRRWFIFIWLFYSYRQFAHSGDISIQFLADQFGVRYGSVWKMIDAIRSNDDGWKVYQQLCVSLTGAVLAPNAPRP